MAQSKTAEILCVGTELLLGDIVNTNAAFLSAELAALGYSGAEFDPDLCDIYYDGVPVVTDGGDAGTPEADLADIVKKDSFTIRCDFKEGSSDYWGWSSDISYEYVKINADYHT